jgi:hypothetical protein
MSESAVGMAAGYCLDGTRYAEGRFLPCTVQTSLCGPLTLIFNGLPGRGGLSVGKAAGA